MRHDARRTRSPRRAGTERTADDRAAGGSAQAMSAGMRRMLLRFAEAFPGRLGAGAVIAVGLRVARRGDRPAPLGKEFGRLRARHDPAANGGGWVPWMIGISRPRSARGCVR
jgi:hypothetical protein